MIKALQHSAFAVGRKLQIDWIESTDLDPNDRTDNHEEAWEVLESADGILVPGGFGNRGVEGRSRQIMPESMKFHILEYV